MSTARAHLRRWAVQRRHLAERGEPLPWQAVAADAVLDALERSEAANRGMVLNSLEAVPESEAA